MYVRLLSIGSQGSDEIAEDTRNEHRFYLENTNPTVPKEDSGTDAASPYVTADETHARTHTVV